MLISCRHFLWNFSGNSSTAEWVCAFFSLSLVRSFVRSFIELKHWKVVFRFFKFQNFNLIQKPNSIRSNRLRHQSQFSSYIHYLLKRVKWNRKIGWKLRKKRKYFEEIDKERKTYYRSWTDLFSKKYNHRYAWNFRIIIISISFTWTHSTMYDLRLAWCYF